MNIKDIRRGGKVALVEGKNTARLLQAEDVNFLFGMAQALLNLRIVIRQTDGTSVLPPVYPDIKISASGIDIVIDPINFVPNAGGSGPSSSGNVNYRGSWSATVASSTSPYNIFDWVQLGAGTSAGTYLNLVQGNLTEPDIGPGWLQISTGSGTWL